jgi:hypothetical protein
MKPLALVSNVLFVTLALVAGCADDDSTASGQDDVTSKPKIGTEGGMCGGIGGFRCNAGLECKIEAQHPDAAGVCVAVKPIKPGTEGGMCGGIAGFRCDDGLECRMEAQHPDASGICTKRPAIGAEGGMCGGIGGFRCNEGLECKIDQPGFDVAGVCVKK